MNKKDEINLLIETLESKLNSIYEKFSDHEDILSFNDFYVEDKFLEVENLLEKLKTQLGLEGTYWYESSNPREVIE